MSRRLVHFVLVLSAWFFPLRAANAALLVGDWNFDEPSGDTVFDHSGFGNDGQLTGATRSAGKVGQGLTFHGSFEGPGGVTIPHSPSLDSLPDGFTFSAWINPTSGATSDYMTIFYKSGAVLTTPDPDIHAQLHIRVNDPTGQLQFVTNDNVHFGGFQGFTADHVVPLDEWSYLTWTYDNATERVYVDGTEIFNAPFNQPWAGNTDPLYIGQRITGFTGMIDEARVYDGALTQDQILRDMNGGPVIPEPSALFLFGIGLVGLLSYSRRQPRHSSA